MIKPQYIAQVELLLDVLPYVAKEKCFALKGGTAINMFMWNMPRLSVDIDLTYIYFDSREDALDNISDSLLRIKADLSKNIPTLKIEESYITTKHIDKIKCLRSNVQIKIEVNTTMRGIIEPTKKLQVSQSVRDIFDKFAAIQVQSKSEIFGGKICAALDRQHPRDLFDIYNLFKLEGRIDEFRNGFLAALLSHNKSIHEVLKPNLQDQRKAFSSQFAGMTNEKFEYEDFESMREKLIKDVNNLLTNNDKKLLLSIKSGAPDWSLCNIEKLQDLPAIQWRLLNIRKIKQENPDRHRELMKELEKVLFS